jgi:PPE-repeat protein
VVNFSLVPPDVNSVVIYSAPGWKKLGAAASEWDCFAMGLYSTAVIYEAMIADLITKWPGPLASVMAGAAAQYASGITAIATQAADAGAKARAAEKTFKTTFAMAVPPLAIAANRAWLTTLATTNPLGQNAQAIAATETHYLEMWAQDAVAMNGYVAAFHDAVKMPPSSKPATATLAAASVTPPVAAADDVSLSAMFANPMTEQRWALSSLMAPGWPSNTVGQLASPGTVPRGTGSTDATSAPERLAMYPVSMLAQAAQMSRTGALDLTADSNGLFNGFGQLVDRTEQLVVEKVADQPRAWMAKVSVQVARAITLGGLSIPSAWLAAAPELSHTAPELPLTGTGARTVSGVERAPKGGSTNADRPFGGRAVDTSAGSVPAEMIPGLTGRPWYAD